MAVARDANSLADEGVPGHGTVWLAGVLWGDAAEGVTVEGFGSGSRSVGTYGILPSRTDPRLLVSLGSRRSAAASAHQFNNAMSQLARVRKATAGLALRAGLLQPFIRDRLVVRAPDEVDRGAQPLIEDHLRFALRRPDLRMAIMPGRPGRPNRKPVLQLSGKDGVIIGYAKVGWNPLTRRLVRNEARVLRAWAARPPGTFVVPRLLYAGSWRDLDITVTSPVVGPTWRRARRNALPPLAVLREVAGLGQQSRASLAESRFWADLGKRGAALAQAGSATAERLGDVMEGVDPTEAGTILRYGTSHGDWAPWNMEHIRGRWHIWDWERCRDGLPVGIDAVHFHFQLAFQAGLDPAEAVRSSMRRSRYLLDRLGLGESEMVLLHRLYLVELLLRYEEGRPGQATSSRLLSTLLAIEEA